MARILRKFGRLCAVSIAFTCGAACSPPARFDAANGAAHVRALADRIGSRPTGTEPNRQARDYIIEQARAAGFDVRVQEADGARPLYGASAHVRNIIATRAGRRPYAIALVTHYDSVPDGPGAADDALGVAVCLEAGRVLARAPRNYALALIFTDGEELGMMGASALLKDPIVGWIRASLNFESIGAAGPALLFETTPQSGSLVDAWKHTAWRPAGSAFMFEIYRRLPADTDLSILKRVGLAGANFAPAGDSYAYHTARDTAHRLDPYTLTQMGENAVATAEALDALDLSVRKATPATYFDVARLRAVTYGRRAGLALLAVALLAGLFGWIQAIAVARDVAGLRRVMFSGVWIVVTAVATVGAMTGAAWLMRATRESYHPWYAHPARFYAFEVFAAALAAWLIVRAARWLPERFRGSFEPAALWVWMFPTWIVSAIALQAIAPSAVYLAALPLIAAAAAIVIVSLRALASAVIVALVALVAVMLLWLSDVLLLLQFAVALLGRLPVVTPVVVPPVLLFACGLFIVPSFVALCAALRHFFARRNDARSGRRAINVGPFVAAGAVVSCAWCWFSPAYTDERPLQKTIQYVNDVVAGRAHWEVGSNEPGIDVGGRAPVAGGWSRTTAPFRYGTPLEMTHWPFAYQAASSIAETPPLSVSGSLNCDAAGCAGEIRAVPSVDGLVLVFTLPTGVTPDETSLPGVVEHGRYRAIYAAVPRSGVTWRLRVPRAHADDLRGMRVVAVSAGLPGAPWPRLPGWLPLEHVVWHARSYFAVPVAFDGGAPHAEGGTIK